MIPTLTKLIVIMIFLSIMEQPYLRVDLTLAGNHWCSVYTRCYTTSEWTHAVRRWRTCPVRWSASSSSGCRAHCWGGQSERWDACGGRAGGRGPSPRRSGCPRALWREDALLLRGKNEIKGTRHTLFSTVVGGLMVRQDISLIFGYFLCASICKCDPCELFLLKVVFV